jgi:signal transduction histidine kinase
MDRHLRILLLEPNKYYLLLIEREFAYRLPETILTQFQSVDAALKEMAGAIYDIAIIDDLIVPGGSGEFFAEMRQHNPDLLAVVLTERKTNEMPAPPGRPEGVEYLAKDERFPAQLPDTVRRLVAKRKRDITGSISEVVMPDLPDTDLIRLTAGTLSHEINNPLMTILGLTELLLAGDSDIDSEVERKIRVIRRSARQIKSSMDRLSRDSQMTLHRTGSGDLIRAEKS